MPWRVKGHDSLIDGFRRVVARGRLAHAYLFTGPRGIGKALFGVELGRALLCEAPKAPLDPCGDCPACVQIDARSHPDFAVYVRPEEANEFPVEVMREVCASFSLKSARGKGKVVLVDDADDLNEESANCFLKTLEEPPKGSVLILVGSDSQRQLPTINSRCQIARFSPLGSTLVREILKTKEFEDVAVRERLVALSGGSPGYALALNDPSILEFRDKLLAGLGRTPFDSVALCALTIAFIQEAGTESAPKRRRTLLAIRLLVELLDDVLNVAIGRTPRHSSEAETSHLRALAGCSPEAFPEVIDRCLEAEMQVGRMAIVELLVEGMFDALGQRLEK